MGGRKCAGHLAFELSFVDSQLKLCNSSLPAGGEHK